VAGVEAVDDSVDERGFRFVGVDAEDFGVHAGVAGLELLYRL
jgi:hypothetical protein